LEKGGTFNATQDAIRKREEEFLATLREMKVSMLKDEQEGGGKNGGGSSTEMAALREENARLKAKLTKQEYRIGHLVNGMEKMLVSK